MSELESSASWRTLTSGQQMMLRRLEREGFLPAPGPWEMRTVRSLLARGLVRPRRPGDVGAGLWFLSAKGSRILPRDADKMESIDFPLARHP